MSQLTANELGLPQLKNLMDKNFWTRPEGTAAKGLVVLLGLALAAGLFVSLPAILAYLLAVISTGTQIVIHLGFLGLVFALVTSPRVRALSGAMFRAAVRKVTGIFVDMAPVDIARDFISYSKKKLTNGEEAGKRFKAKMGVHLKTVNEFKLALEEQEALAKQYIRKKMHDEAQATQTRAERTRKRVNSLEGIYSKMETLARALDTILRKAKLKVKNTEDELEDQIKMFNVAMDAKYAMADVKEAIGATGSTRKEMADMAAARMALTVAEVVIEIDDMIQLSEELFSGVDAQEAVLSERALKRFEQWEKEAQSSVLGPGEKAALIEDALNPTKPYDLTISNTSPDVVSEKRINVNDFFSN